MIDKEKALHQFWSSFGVTAYDENTVPENAMLPRITYNVVTDHIGNTVAMTASIWDRSTVWNGVTEISHRIAHKLMRGGYTRGYADGIVWIKPGTPFMQRMSDPDDSIRRILVNIEVEYFSEE